MKRDRTWIVEVMLPFLLTGILIAGAGFIWTIAFDAPDHGSFAERLALTGMCILWLGGLVMTVLFTREIIRDFGK